MGPKPAMNRTVTSPMRSTNWLYARAERRRACARYRLSFLFATVMQRHHAGCQAPGREELEPARALEAVKQRRSVAREDRMDDETVPVDQPQSLERGRQPGAAHEEAGRGLFLELRDGF